MATTVTAQQITGVPGSLSATINIDVFHSTSLCSPTRAALITGRNRPAVGYGVVGEAATGFPGYDSIIKRETGTIGEILKEHGYATSWFGKSHNALFYQASQARPFDQWPIGMGFDHFYGFVGGDTSSFKFTGTIDKLTFELGPTQYTEEDREQLPVIADRVARARD